MFIIFSFGAFLSVNLSDFVCFEMYLFMYKVFMDPFGQGSPRGTNYNGGSGSYNGNGPNRPNHNSSDSSTLVHSNDNDGSRRRRNSTNSDSSNEVTTVLYLRRKDRNATLPRIPELNRIPMDPIVDQPLGDISSVKCQLTELAKPISYGISYLEYTNSYF